VSDLRFRSSIRCIRCELAASEIRSIIVCSPRQTLGQPSARMARYPSYGRVSRGNSPVGETRRILSGQERRQELESAIRASFLFAFLSNPSVHAS